MLKKEYNVNGAFETVATFDYSQRSIQSRSGMIATLYPDG